MTDDRTTNTLLVSIYQELGELRGQVNILLEERGRAADSRAAIHDKIDHVDECIHKQIDDIRSALLPVSAIVERLEPVVDELEKQRQQAIGAIWIIRAIMLSAAAVVGALTATIAKKFGWG